MHDLHDLCRDSKNDHGATVKDCWQHAAENLLHGRLKDGEAQNVFAAMFDLAHKGSTPPTWDLVGPVLLSKLADFYRAGGAQNGRGDTAVPGFSALVDMMARSANEGAAK